MLGHAGQSLGLECTFLDPAESPPARTAGTVIADRFDAERGLAALMQRADVISYEFENVPVETVEALSTPVYPPADALRESQDRLREKTLFDRLDIPVPAYRRIDALDDLRAAAVELGLPLVVKTRRLGYDGKGQSVLRHKDDPERAFSRLGGRDLIAEEWVSFDYEVSIIAARSVSGELAFYPLTQNRHADGILRVSRAPVSHDALTATATTYARRLLTHLDYVGILALEMFVKDGTLLANEFAPRVHNSGHWTIEGAATSQFENHLRAILDMPLGPTGAVAHAGMINLIGEMPDSTTLGALQDAFLHNYGKTPRPGRKLGHITVLGEDAGLRDLRLEALEALLEK